MKISETGVSVVICVYNGSKRLPETIRHLSEQQVSETLQWEIVIIDNNSTDDTANVAQSVIKNYSGLHKRFRIIEEPESGLTFARHRGVQEAKFEYIIFCDDDNWLCKDYIQTAFHILSADTQIGALGGQSKAVADQSFPDWWADSCSSYAVGKQAQESGDISEKRYLWGSGMCFRRSVYLEAFEKIPSLLTDRKGNTLAAGGDTEICARFLLMGYTLHYDERLAFTHFIPCDRLTWNYRKQLFDGFKNAYTVLYCYFMAIDVSGLTGLKKTRTLAKTIYRTFLGKLFRSNFQLYKDDLYQSFFLSGIPRDGVSDEAKEIRRFMRSISWTYFHDC